jgi:heterodisulfide reductase subunit C
MVHDMDAGPAKTLRLLQLGLEDELFALNTPWLCASCETCVTRCPNEIDTALVMDLIRQMARLKGKTPAVRQTALFQDIFLSSMKNHGRLFEVELMALYNLRSGHPFKDIELSPGMFMKGRLGLFPHRSKNRSKLRAIFERAEKMEKEEAGHLDNTAGKIPLKT